jgi:hypothetical protein
MTLHTHMYRYLSALLCNTVLLTAKSSSANNFTCQKHVTPQQVKDLTEEYDTNITGTCESRVDVFH